MLILYCVYRVLSMLNNRYIKALLVIYLLFHISVLFDRQSVTIFAV